MTVGCLFYCPTLNVFTRETGSKTPKGTSNTVDGVEKVATCWVVINVLSPSVSSAFKEISVAVAFTRLKIPHTGSVTFATQSPLKNCKSMRQNYRKVLSLKFQHEKTDFSESATVRMAARVRSKAKREKTEKGKRSQDFVKNFKY